MKLLRVGKTGYEKAAVLDKDGNARDLSKHIDDLAGSALDPDSLAGLAALDPDSLPKLAPDRIGPCVGNVGKFICIGLNFADHAAEASMSPPSEPIVFLKANSAICGANDDVLIPRGCTKMDWEVELGVVIGTRAKYVDEGDAMEHVAGFCVVNDVSERELQIERGGQWDKGKGYDTFGPIGPWLVTRDEIARHDDLAMWLDVDGTRRQTGSTNTMIFTVPQIISYLSGIMPLNPGDVIATGTPPGVGMGFKPPIYAQAGQEIRLGIDGLGEQCQTLRQD